MGTIVDPDWLIKSDEKQPGKDQVLPEMFDSRINWAACKDVIGNIRDQSNCGSCWAFGTTEAFNDRVCISSGGKLKQSLSTADTTGCCNSKECFSFGCNGGQVGTPWKWFEKTGVVTGGAFGEGALCYDYPMSKCNHHQP